ncbi:MAG: hypothetical protein ACPHCI_04100 [Solirubrobacterales bacterium]
MAEQARSGDARGNFEYESVESILSRAFEPVDPPARLYDQFETRLEQLSLGAAEELADWELAAMRDPRNWVKPATAVVVGSAAAGALVVLGLRHRRRDDDKGAAAVKALGDALGDAVGGAGREAIRSARKLSR